MTHQHTDVRASGRLRGPEPPRVTIGAQARAFGAAETRQAGRPASRFASQPFAARAVVFALGIMVFATALAAAAGSRCDFCRKEITGRYFTYEEHSGGKMVICESCERTVAHCGLCKIPVRGRGETVGGALLCSHCGREAKTCAVCKQLIRGGYYTFKIGAIEEFVCDPCKRTAPRCSACNRPVPPEERRQSGATMLCNHCDTQVPTCASCGGRCMGSYYSINFRDGVFCESCWKDRPVCSICGAPVGDRYTKLDDGRNLCSECAATAVLDSDKVNEIYAKVRPFLEKQLGAPLKTPVRLRLVGPGEIGEPPRGYRGSAASWKRKTASEAIPEPEGPKRAGEAGAEAAGADAPRGIEGRELGKFVRLGGDFEIRVLSGQPESWVWETVAHEFAHAWQSEKNSDLEDLAWSEGFAQWAAEMVLEDRGETRLLERLRHRQDFYGQAYRLVNRYEVLRGKRGVLHYILTVRHEDSPGLPWHKKQ